MVLTGWSQGPRHQYHLGTCQKCDFLCLIPDLLNQRLGTWGPGACLSVGHSSHREGSAPCLQDAPAPGLQESCRGAPWTQLPSCPARWVFGAENSVEELMSSRVSFWQGINAHTKCTNVWFLDPEGEGKKKKKHQKHTGEMER